MPTVARVIAESLQARGTSQFFCATGGDQPLWIEPDRAAITFVPCRSEHAAAYAAYGYARATGRPAFVYGQYGSGVASVATGLADARPDRAAELVRAAVRQAVSTPPGPVHLEICADLLGAEAEWPAVPSGPTSSHPLPRNAVPGTETRSR